MCRRFRCEKLVRDNAIEDCTREGARIGYRILEENKYLVELLRKIQEESKELKEELKREDNEESIIEELGDVFEVLKTLKPYGEEDLEVLLEEAKHSTQQSAKQSAQNPESFGESKFSPDVADRLIEWAKRGESTKDLYSKELYLKELYLLFLNLIGCDRKVLKKVRESAENKEKKRGAFSRRVYFEYLQYPAWHPRILYFIRRQGNGVYEELPVPEEENNRKPFGPVWLCEEKELKDFALLMKIPFTFGHKNLTMTKS